MNELAEIHRSPLGRATIGDQLRRHAQHDPNRLALVFYAADGAREEHTYGSLNDRVNRFASALRDRGVGRGDRVAMMSHNSPDYVTAWYATLKLGGVFTGINFTFKPAEIEYQVNHAEPKVLIVEDCLLGSVPDRAQLPSVSTYFVSSLNGQEAGDGWTPFSELVSPEFPAAEPDADVDELDVAMIVYTSGTEAFPKGVMIPHRNYLISTAPAWSWGLDTGPKDTWLFVMPFHTIAGLGSMTTLTVMGATLVLPYAVDPARALGMIADEGITVVAQTPTFFLAVSREPGFAASKVETIRNCLTYGGVVPQAMIDAWRAVLPDIQWGTYWGQSELSQLGSIGWFSTLDDVPDGDPSWIGKPVTHLEVRVIDEGGGAAEIGELLCRSPSVMLGYYKDAEKTAEVMRDGWVHTGDVVRTDKEGNLFFYDRRKDMIKTGGMNVSSVEVERVLYQHPDVFQVAVVGVPDEYWSEAVNAFVVPKPDTQPDPDAIIAHCKKVLSGFKVPKAVHIVEDLPKDSQGKILKRELRRSVAEA